MARSPTFRVLAGLAILPIYVAVAVNAATNTTFPGPLRLIQLYPWQSLLVGLAATAAFVMREARSPGDSRPLTDAEESRLRARLLAETRRIWVDGVLTRSLGEMLRLELSLVSRQSRVTHPTQVLLRGYGDGDEVVAPGTSPAEVFARLGQRLLILGGPGAGKTTMLLELARDLTNDPDPADPVPVVLNLSSWPAGKATFEEWVVAELRRFYDLTERDARHVIGHGIATLLLDGLDEVPTARLRTCVRALNDFRDRHGGTPIAVTCRIADYDAEVKPLLKLTGAVLIQPLTEQEADAWLALIGPELDGLRAAIAADEALRDMLRTPLTLSIAALAYQGTDIETPTGLEGLFAAYTQRMLDRPRAALADAVYTDADARRWLSSLAAGMTATDAAGINPRAATRLREAWFGENAIDQTQVYRRLTAFGMVPIGIVAAVTTLLLGPWQAVPVVAVAAGAAAWVRVDAPTWFIGTYLDWHLKTAGEEARRESTATATAVGIGLVNLTLGWLMVRMIVTTEPSWFIRIYVGGWILFMTTFFITVSVMFWVNGAANLADALATSALTWLARRLGRLPTSLLAVLIAGVAAGAAGVLITRIATALAKWAFWGIEPEYWTTFVAALAIGPLGGLAAGVVFAAQYAVSDVHTPRTAYQQQVRSGAWPGDLGAFLAWADGRIILRKTGAEYQFVHRLYRDWWARQGR